MAKVPFTLGEVGHFGLAVGDPEKSAKWFERALGLRKEFDFDNGVAVGNDYHPKRLIICRFIYRTWRRYERRSPI